MKKIIALMFVVSLISCGTSSKINKSLLYDIPNNKTKELIIKEINVLKSLKKNAFLVFGKNKEGYTIQIIPTSDLKDNIQNLKIKNSNRMIHLDDKYYLIVFDYDYELGATFNKETENGEIVIIKRKKMYLYDYASCLFFDDNWNFIKKQSLIQN
ncbi:hypothetical protein BD847_1751 [Flavobacterium cutihirudinis]|uniref:Lipoprotein n=1 Tax=Flavobacterium cutihirudinis TaxID=1265740 RepID=A0A3D9FY07_9FLAO|nr:hypothetical protein [Flavobacterium cutihirudinis]RED25012.1 hypothetical protein BD847_1751 [Flavobacterium cutihirudinis]